MGPDRSPWLTAAPCLGDDLAQRRGQALGRRSGARREERLVEHLDADRGTHAELVERAEMVDHAEVALTRQAPVHHVLERRPDGSPTRRRAAPNRPCCRRPPQRFVVVAASAVMPEVYQDAGVGAVRRGGRRPMPSRCRRWWRRPGTRVPPADPGRRRRRTAQRSARRPGRVAQARRSARRPLCGRRVQRHVEVGLHRVDVCRNEGWPSGAGPSQSPAASTSVTTRPWSSNSNRMSPIGEALALRGAPVAPPEQRDGVEVGRGRRIDEIDERHGGHGHVAQHECGRPSLAAGTPCTRGAYIPDRLGGSDLISNSYSIILFEGAEQGSATCIQGRAIDSRRRWPS